MLVISNEQMTALKKAIRKPDKKELQDELAEIFPTVAKDDLERFIDIGLEKTARYEIDEDHAVSEFIYLMIVVAQDFDEHPKVHEQLTRRDPNPNLCVRLARELVTPDEWREAEQHGLKLDLGDQKYYV